MFKTITTIILTVIIVLFAMQNFDHVPVYIFSGKAINIRLIFVIAVAGVLGYLVRHIVGIGIEERLKRQIQIMKRVKDNGSKRNSALEDDIF